MTGWLEFGKIIHLTGVGENIWWPPLYGFYLSLYYHLGNFLPYILRGQQILFVSLLVLFYSFFGKSTNKSVVMRWMLLLILIPLHIICASVPVSETFFLLLLMIHIFFFLKFFAKQKMIDFFYSLLFLTLATFSKPVSLYFNLIGLPIMLLLLLVKNYINKRHILILLLLSLAIPQLFYSLWSQRNFRKTGINTFANVQNYNLLAHNYYHIHNYVEMLKKGELQISNIGTELLEDKGERLRRYLKGDFLDQYIIEKGVDPNEISDARRYVYAGELGKTLIFKNILLYSVMHIIKSIALFFPNLWEPTKLLVLGNFKYVLFGISFAIGAFVLFYFTRSLMFFIVSFRNSKIGYNSIVSLTFLTHALYIFLAVGPTAFDDGGRYGFIVYFFLIGFIISVNTTHKHLKWLKR
ncbi:hypothetical protein C4564_00755 [Candidatus Microgenomates bacterium]|nr:MAG: hypothetical protein C4564_00755 [Candidatus Microgenomates bacterium]